MAQNPLSSAEVFLKIADQFQLGDLPTEKSHPLTTELSKLSRENLNEALLRLKQIDIEALKVLLKSSVQLEELRLQVKATWKEKGRVFLCGCGATGRLALTLETIYRDLNPNGEAVVSFMAGGDVALVHAIEGFEDHPEYGARQLMELGFSQNDLLICCTEGGETPFVIGAALKGAEVSRRPVAFMFCNPTELLKNKLERCAKVLNHSQVVAYELCVGPMALCGSTRLQASTVLMLAAGLAMFTDDAASIETSLSAFIQSIEQLNYLSLKDFIRTEAEIYAKGQRVVYQVTDLSISVFTDTTERAPTFSLQAFQPETTTDTEASWSFIEIPSAKGPVAAWEQILKRKPRSLGWQELNTKTTGEYLVSFDFSQGAQNRRQLKWPKIKFESFEIKTQNEKLVWNFCGHRAQFEVGQQNLLFQHTILKLLLNAHSTLIMGVLGRYEGNWMTYVYPTNAKLVDRATRYILGILKREGIRPSYEDVVTALFKKFPIEKRGQSLVLELVEEFKSRSKG